MRENKGVRGRGKIAREGRAREGRYRASEREQESEREGRE